MAGLAAVADDGLTDNVLGIVGRKEKGDPPDVAGFGDKAGRHRPARRLNVKRIPEYLAMVFDEHPSWRDRIHTNSSLDEFEREFPRVGNDRALRAGVDRVFGHPSEGVHGSEVDHDSLAAFSQRRQHGLRKEELRADVDMVERVKLLQRDLLKGNIERDARIIHEHIQPAEKSRSLASKLRDRRGVAEIGSKRFRLASLAEDFLCSRNRAGSVPSVMQGDGGAFASKLESHSPANSCAGPRNQDSLTLHATIVLHDDCPPQAPVARMFADSSIDLPAFPDGDAVHRELRRADQVTPSQHFRVTNIRFAC